MARTQRFQPGDQIEYICHDQDPAAPTGGWVPGTFQHYLPRTPTTASVLAAGHIGGPADMKAIVIPQGRGEDSALTVPIGELRFPPPAPGPVTQPPPPGETGDVMPTVANGMLVVSAFRILPVYGRAVFTWRVILRDREPEWDAPATYAVTRVRWTPAAPGVADGEWQDIDADENEGFRGLAWTIAALTFAHMVKLDAAPHGED
jgi:hypothetical protein